MNPPPIDADKLRAELFEAAVKAQVAANQPNEPHRENLEGQADAYASAYALVSRMDSGTAVTDSWKVIRDQVRREAEQREA